MAKSKEVKAADEFNPEGVSEGTAATVNTGRKAPKSATPVVATQESSAAAAFLETKTMSYMEDNHLRNLKKKVQDGLTYAARGELVGTGIIGVDVVMQGGVNFGSIHEFFGFSKTAKSYLMQKVALEAQTKLPDCYVVFLDRENAYDAARVMSMGFDVSRTIIIPARMIPEPDDAFLMMMEQAEDIQRLHMRYIEKKSGKAESEDAEKKKKEPERKLYCRDYDSEKSPHIVFVIDSIPAFAEQEKLVEDQGRRAKKWHAVLRRVTGFLDPKVMVLASNHVIYKPGMFATQVKTSGLAIDYYRDCGIELHNLAPIQDDDGVEIGVLIHLRMDKTRRGAAGGETYFPIYYKGGAQRFSGILPYMEYLGLATVSNATAFKNGKYKVWANYEIAGVPGKVSEKNAEDLEGFVRSNNLITMILEREKELFK